MTRSAESAPDTVDPMADLPVNPFRALRVAYGMLLGEDDFRELMGNPRGKQMLHAAWLHGSGVVWGLGVRTGGEHDVLVGPGLAVDGMGRELRLETTDHLDVRCLWSDDPPPLQDCARRTVGACLVLEFDSCPTAPVPTLADPCDVTREHDDDSRVLERARVALRPVECPLPERPYHRLRVLFGLDDVGSDDRPGADAARARAGVAACHGSEQAAELLREFRRLAAADVAERSPAGLPGEEYPTLFPQDEDSAPVVLAGVEVDVRDVDGRVEVLDVRLDPAARTALLPTATIQELLCGAPLTGAASGIGAEGPRVDADGVDISEDGCVLTLPVTAPLHPGSVRRAVAVTSLSARGWVDEDIGTIRYDPDTPAVVVELADRPAGALVRVVVRGTGPVPVYGEDPLAPLAGVVGGPPSSRHDGHDAVVTLQNPTIEPRYSR